jgi:hypothetical protein
LVQSFLENLRTWIDWCLEKVKRTDGQTGTVIFVLMYIIYCLTLIFICKFWYKKSKPKRVRKQPQEPPMGKRSSQRIRLQKHELVFVERITPEEFEKQKGAFTQEQINQLQSTKEYAKMKRQRGKAIENWNW